MIRPAAQDTVLLGMGSNQGDRLANLRAGAAALALHPEIRLEAVSSLYETDYVGPGEQDPYLNGGARIATTLTPGVLLTVLKGIEARLGREPGGHMRPRPLDLDILLFGSRIIGQSGLTVPHPRLRERAFALVPLAEIAFSWTFPDSGETIGQACAKIWRKSGPGIRPWQEPLIPSAGTIRPGTKEDWRAALAVHCR